MVEDTKNNIKLLDALWRHSGIFLKYLSDDALMVVTFGLKCKNIIYLVIL